MRHGSSMTCLISNTALASVEPPGGCYTPSALRGQSTASSTAQVLLVTGVPVPMQVATCWAITVVTRTCVRSSTDGTRAGHQDAALASSGEKGRFPWV